MPTEKEKKFVLKTDTENYFAEIADEKLFIRQGYLLSSKGITLRFRQSISSTKKKENYFLTFKYTVNGRVIEIEKKIDERDFEDMWTQCLNKVVKIRYLVKDTKENIWEIDFFKDHNNETYFAMAEFEMPEDKDGPDFMPNFISENLVYEVSLTDSRFSSKLLGDVRYAIEIMNGLRSNQ